MLEHFDVKTPGLPANTYLPFFTADKYMGYAIGTKYTVAGAGTQFSVIYNRGEFTNVDGSIEGPKIDNFALGIKHPINPTLVALGSTEVPFFANGSANVGAVTSVYAIGIRHQF